MFYINPIEEDVVWVTTDDDAIGVEVKFDSDVGEGEKALVALAEYLGYEPIEVLSIDGIGGIKYQVIGG